MRYFLYIIVVSVLVLSGCSVKKNNFFSRNYHQMTTRYNVYFNGNQALKSGIKVMENRHKEDYTNLLPVFVSNNEQTRALCASDMDYATEKAAKAIDKHSITAKPRRIRRATRLSGKRKNLINSWISVICCWEKLISIRRNMLWLTILSVLFNANMLMMKKS